MRIALLFSIIALSACQDEEMVDLEELTERTRANLVYVAGGTFKPGTYTVALRQPDGEIEMREVGNSARRNIDETTLDGFYIQAFLPTTAEYITFRKETGLPPLIAEYVLEAAAAMPFHEATNYCAWLSELTGLSMRLPTENEWEYAARSRILSPPFGTDNGNWEPPRNIWSPEDGESFFGAAPAPGDLPSSPMGLYDLHGVLDQWVSDRGPNDPDDVRIAKASSYSETGWETTIAGRNVVERTPRSILNSFPNEAPYFADGALFNHHGLATARCVVDKAEPPNVTGFGREIAVAPDALPEVFDAYVPQGMRLD